MLSEAPTVTDNAQLTDFHPELLNVLSQADGGIGTMQPSNQGLKTLKTLDFSWKSIVKYFSKFLLLRFILNWEVGKRCILYQFLSHKSGRKKDLTIETQVYVLPLVIVIILLVIGLIFTIYLGYKRKQLNEVQIKKLNQDLQASASALKAANNELETFAYSVSHDLRAPLRHIDGFIDLLQKQKETALDERSQHYMEVISDSAKHLNSLIDDLLKFSRMGRQELSWSKVDLNALVQDIIQELESLEKDRIIKWHITDLPIISADCTLIRTVFVNLISNAIKFTRLCKQAEINIESQIKKKENIILIRDNGVGFDQKYSTNLFGVFQRLHHTDEFEGTGIGLANVHRIIKRHGGKTWAEGIVDRGAIFYFSLPIID